MHSSCSQVAGRQAGLGVGLNLCLLPTAARSQRLQSQWRGSAALLS